MKGRSSSTRIYFCLDYMGLFLRIVHQHLFFDAKYRALEDVVELAVESLRPELVAIGGVDELNRDPDPFPRLPDAPFQNRIHAQAPSDLPHLEKILKEGILSAYRRATANGELKATVREKFGSLGDAFMDTRLHPISVRQDVVAAEYEVDPRTMDLGEMVRYTTDISRQVAAAHDQLKYNYISTLTQLARELLASSEGMLIDQAFALTQGLCYVVAVSDATSHELYDVLGHHVLAHLDRMEPRIRERVAQAAELLPYGGFEVAVGHRPPVGREDSALEDRFEAWEVRRAQGSAEVAGPHHPITGQDADAEGEPVVFARILAGAVLSGGREIGRVTSGTFSPTLARSIAMAYVDPPWKTPGSACEVDVRGKSVSARVVPLPFYKRDKT